MKLKLNVAILSLLFALPAFADHGDGGGVARLHEDTHRLESIVQNSYLRYRVKLAVRRLTSEVSALFKCSGSDEPGGDEPGGPGGGGGEPGGPVHLSGTWDHVDPTGSCEAIEQRVRQAWYPVDRYLYDSYYDLPQVYQAYVQVRQDMLALQ